MKYLIGAIFLIIHSAFADDSYFGRCVIKDKTVISYVCSRGSYSGSGKGTIYFYDKNGSEIDNTWTTWVAVVVNECEAVDQESAPNNASFCEFAP